MDYSSNKKAWINIGHDLKKETIEWRKSINKYNNHHYYVFDITKEIPERSDAIIFRDLAIHLAHFENMIAINNMKKSGSRFLLAGTFKGEKNYDLKENTFRKVDLEAAPYNLPKPIDIIPDPIIKDGSPTKESLNRFLALWRMDDIEYFPDEYIYSYSPKTKKDTEHIISRARRHHYNFSNLEVAANLYKLALKVDPEIKNRAKRNKDNKNTWEWVRHKK